MYMDQAPTISGLRYSNFQEWDQTFVELAMESKSISNPLFPNLKLFDSLTIKEVIQQPTKQMIFDALYKLRQFVINSHQNNNLCLIDLVGSSPLKNNPTFSTLKEASDKLCMIAMRMTSIYEFIYMNKLGLLHRIHNAIYHILGWQTERDKIHQLSVEIQQTLHYARYDFVPDGLIRQEEGIENIYSRFLRWLRWQTVVQELEKLYFKNYLNKNYLPSSLKKGRASIEAQGHS